MAGEVAVGAAVSPVNLSEVVAKLNQAGMPEAVIRRALDPLGLEVVDFDVHLAYRTALLQSLTKRAGLSLGDRSCLALAQHLGLSAVTADRSWSGLGLPIAVHPIR